MTDPNFRTVFNLAESGYRDWWFPAFGLIFVAIGLVLPKLFEAGIFPEYQKRWTGSWFPKLFVGFAVFWTALSLIFTLGEYLKDREALLTGKAGYVEGTVTDFVPMPYSGHAQESFTVSGVPFHYSDYEVTGGFNNTASHGGPIREGLFVRIWYLGNDILKLQVPKNGSAETLQPLPPLAKPPLITFPLFMVAWIAFGAGSWIFITRLPTPQVKKAWSDRFAIVAGVIFFAFICTQFGSAKNAFSIYFMGPAIVLITWLNVRNTYYCDKCGKRSLNSNWFGSTYSCPHCGNKLR